MFILHSLETETTEKLQEKQSVISLFPEFTSPNLEEEETRQQKTCFIWAAVSFLSFTLRSIPFFP